MGREPGCRASKNGTSRAWIKGGGKYLLTHHKFHNLMSLVSFTVYTGAAFPLGGVCSPASTCKWLPMCAKKPPCGPALTRVWKSFSCIIIRSEAFSCLFLHDPLLCGVLGHTSNVRPHPVLFVVSESQNERLPILKPCCGVSCLPLFQLELVI